MASTTFVDNQTVIYAAWLNDVNNVVYNGIFQSSSITASSMICTGTASGTGFTNLINNTFSAPAAIGSATPNTGAFTTLSATTGITLDGVNVATTTGTQTLTNKTLAIIKSSASFTPTVFQDSNGTAIGVLCRAWAQYNGNTTTLNGNFNISSVTRVSAGLYTFNFTNAMPNANYATTTGISYDLSTGTGNVYVKITSQTTTSVQILITSTASIPLDVAYIAISVFA